jgi:hypothetical protein
MKKVLMIVLASMVIAGYANAARYDYIGLFFDTAHSNCDSTVAGDMALYYYAHAKPGALGMTAVEFKVVFPPIVYDTGSLTLNAGINLTLGDISTGWSATFASCQTAWTQIYRQRVYVDDSIEPNGIIHLAETDDSHNLGLSTCDMMDERFTVLNDAFLNLTCLIGTKEASWGAIKSLFE